ncbi:glycoside hydrolase family 92 protein [Motilibacter sp. E257]|uniref:Glycoside hydrolase family 92 protein n=1 Tax=Motilibacter deserti TaxID=2714956 RepID=A0ABX0GXW7_9ACTN|nr:glycoside hydrolase family 92 protein [Motilibacter deserti]
MATTAVAGAPAASAAEPGGSFSTSFEDAGPALTWSNTVETDASGARRTANVVGPSGSGYAGSVNETVNQITASGENAPNEGKEGAVDGDPASKWLAFSKPSVAAPVWLQYRLSKPAVVVKYAMTSGNDEPGRDPRDWTVQGSNDGTNWTVLDTQTGQTWPATPRGQRREFTIANTQAFTYYKLNITNNNGATIFQLADFLLSDGSTTPPPAGDMRTQIGSGPTAGYNIKPRVGFTGLKALQYTGTVLEKGRGYSWNKVQDVDVPVVATTQLSYKIFPELTDQDLRYPSQYASVDLKFTDGTYLSQLGAVDQQFAKLDPVSQGTSKTLYANQWNYKYSTIGAVAAGKTIDEILVAYDNPNGPAKFGGWIDDITVEAEPARNTSTRPSDWVLTTRGTNSSGSFSRGNNFPAALVPHGFNFWTPQTNAGSTGTFYSYASANNADNLPVIQAFAASHEPSIWMGDRQTFQVMPSAASGVPSANRTTRQLAFRHENEVAKAHYYGVTFENGMKTEIAPTDHAAVMRFTFTGSSGNLVFDNVNNNGLTNIDVANGVVTGYSDVRSGLSNGATRMFMYATFDKPVASGAKLTTEGRNNVTGYVKFDTSGSSPDDKAVTMRIATSLISVDQAKKNLELEVSPTDTLETVRDRAQAMWDDKLDVVDIEGATDDQRTTLYSNLHRLFSWPNSAAENVGTNEAPVWKHAVQSSTATTNPPGTTATQTGAPIADGKVYVNNGFWDTYRTTWSGYSLFSPGMAGELVDGFVQQYKDGGWISRWSSPGYANLMTGTSSDVSFADAYLKGIGSFDVKAAYDAAVKNATVRPPGTATDSNTGRKGLQNSIFLGYTPSSVSEGVSWALEGYINDFGIANMAKALSERTDVTAAEKKRYSEEYEYFINRAENYTKMFDPSIGFFQGRAANGQWKSSPEDYDPEEWGHEHDYTETNGWNFAFHVPFDGQGLANLYGGKAGLEQKLDTFFSTPETGTKPGSYGGTIHEMIEQRDVRLGMWGFSNQVAHHIPWMYNYAGAPEKTQALVRETTRRLYAGSQIGQGYAGDEDNGEQSAWGVFASLGFYPLQVGSPNYVLGSPLFTKATIHLENGKDLVISAPNNSAQNVYVQGVKLNGQAYSKNWVSHADLTNGGTLEFDMGATPSAWGSGDADVPPSLTEGSELPDPMTDITSLTTGRATLGTGAAAMSLFDNSSASVVSLGSGSPSVTWQVNGPKPKTSYYTLTSGTAAGDPSSWTLQGSNDGKTWTTIDTREGETFMWRQQTRAFKMATPGIYGWYRLQVTGITGGTSASLAEVEFLAHRPKVAEAQNAFDALVSSGAVAASTARDLQPILTAAANAQAGHDEAGVAAQMKLLVAQLATLQPSKVSAAAKSALLLQASQWVSPAAGLDLLREQVGAFSASGDIATSTGRDLQQAVATAIAARDAGDRTAMLAALRDLRDTVAGAKTSKVSQAAKDAMLPVLDDLLSVGAPLGNLRDHFNNTGIGDDGLGNADLSEGYYISRQALAAGGVVQGTATTVPGTDLSFTLPKVDPALPDNISASGQVIDASSLPASTTKLSFIATSVLGDTQTTATVTFTDGTTQSVPVQVGDWTLGGSSTAQPRFGNIGIVKTAYRNRGTDTNLGGTPWLFATAPATLTAGKQVKTITLPSTPNLRIFAIAFDGTAAQ